MASELLPLTGFFQDQMIALDGRRLCCVVSRVTLLYSGGDFAIDELFGTFCLKSDVADHPRVLRLGEILGMPVLPTKPPAFFHIAAGGVKNFRLIDCDIRLAGDLMTADGPVNVTLERTTVRRR